MTVVPRWYRIRCWIIGHDWEDFDGMTVQCRHCAVIRFASFRT